MLQGIRTIPNRLVSLFDPDARPIRRGKLSKPVEFGYKLAWVETQEGFISRFQLHVGNPSDDGLLGSAVAGHVRVLGAKPRAVATNRGMSSRARRLFERRRAFRRLVRWRSGQEAAPAGA